MKTRWFYLTFIQIHSERRASISPVPIVWKLLKFCAIIGPKEGLLYCSLFFYAGYLSQCTGWSLWCRQTSSCACGEWPSSLQPWWRGGRGRSGRRWRSLHERLAVNGRKWWAGVLPKLPSPGAVGFIFAGLRTHRDPCLLLSQSSCCLFRIARSCGGLESPLSETWP